MIRAKKIVGMTALFIVQGIYLAVECIKTSNVIHHTATICDTQNVNFNKDKCTSSLFSILNKSIIGVATSIILKGEIKVFTKRMLVNRKGKLLKVVEL